MIIWEGISPFDGGPIVAIVTGWQSAPSKRSKNKKTGEMAQLFILRQDISPLDALTTDADASICGDCPLRGVTVDGKRQNRACYVEIGKSANAVWRKYNRGGYDRVTPEHAGEILAGQAIRLGAYGDPAMVPFDVISALIAHASLWTGYTHQWRNLPTEWAGVLMASADTVSGRREARSMGWRSFYVAPVGADARSQSGAVECAAERLRNPLQCIDCGMCSGTRKGAVSGAVDVVIIAHGPGAKYVQDEALARV